MATLTLDTDQRSLLDPEVAERPRDGGAAAEARAAASRGTAAPTLDDLVARTWSSLLVSRAAACLLCGGDVVPRYGSGPHPVGGACRSCGTEMG
ncbi:MAG TPA: hypothetical protein VG318_13690 [Actinomycetota bacterium]|nr:hypothetical protein [Actinomycetota bacterium]